MPRRAMTSEMGGRRGNLSVDTPEDLGPPRCTGVRADPPATAPDVSVSIASIEAFWRSRPTERAGSESSKARDARCRRLQRDVPRLESAR
jgi:hypothetical protein